MIVNFEEYTHELNQYEEEKLLPVIVKGLQGKKGKENAVTNKQMLVGLKNMDLKVNDARIRKVIAYIRLNKLIKNLISTKKGYHIATTKEEVADYRKSLMQRFTAIQAIYYSFNET